MRRLLISLLDLLAVLFFASVAVGQEERLAVGEGPIGLVLL